MCQRIHGLLTEAEKDTQHCPPNSKQEANETGEGSKKLTREMPTSMSAMNLDRGPIKFLKLLLE